MASRFFVNARLVLTFLTTAISRRGYAAQGAVSSMTRSGGVMMKRRAEDGVGSSTEKQEKSAWGPDPKTGYYRPENRREDIDVAERRAELLKHRD